MVNQKKKKQFLPSKEEFKARETFFKQEAEAINKFEDRKLKQKRLNADKFFEIGSEDLRKGAKQTKLTDKFSRRQKESDIEIKEQITELRSFIRNTKDKKVKQGLINKVNKLKNEFNKREFKFDGLATERTIPKNTRILVHPTKSVDSPLLEVTSTALPDVKDVKRYSIACKVVVGFKRKAVTSIGRSKLSRKRSKEGVEDNMLEAFNNAVRQAYRKLGIRYDALGVAVLEIEFSYVYYIERDLRKELVGEVKRVEARGF